MKVALVSRQKLGFATGEIPKPSAGSKEFDTRETCNGLMLSWLFNVVEQKITTTLLYKDSVAIAWSDLQDRYKIVNKPQIFQMKHDISVRSQGEDNICLYFQKLKSLWDQLDSCVQKPMCVCGNCTCDALKNFIVLEVEDQVLQFLLGRNESHMLIHGQVLSSNKLSNLNRVYALV